MPLKSSTIYTKLDELTLGLRAIERVKGVHHTTVINWVKQVGKLLPDVYDPEVIPEVGELDELQSYVKKTQTKSGCRRRLTTLNQEF